MSSSTSNSEILGECTAHDKKSNEECSCDLFSSGEDPKRCHNCGHRRRHHLVSKPGASKATPEVAAILKNLLQSGRTKSSLKSEAGPSSSRKISLGLEVAQKESNRGMRPAGGESSKGSSSKSKGKGRKSDSKESRFRVASIIIIPYGTKFIEGVLQIRKNNKVPDRIQMQTAVMNGLGVMDLQDGIILDASWSHEELVDGLRDIVPIPFAYFERIEREAGNDEPAWLLATTSQRVLGLPPVPRAKGSDVFYNKGSSSTGFLTSRVFLVSRDPIPQEILEMWVAPESASFRKPATTDGLSSESGDESSEDEPLEKIPAPNKRGRLFSKSSSDEEDVGPVKKKQKGAAARKWSRRPETGSNSNDTSVTIDLTTDDPVQVPEACPAIPNAPQTALTGAAEGDSDDDSYSSEPDPTLGNPYDKAQVFHF